MKKLALVLSFLVLAMAILPLLASETQWNCNLKLYSESMGSSPWDINMNFGVRPNATDGRDVYCDPNIPCDTPKNPPSPVYIYWHRPEWLPLENFQNDYRATLAPGQTKVWQDLRVVANPGTTLFLTWDFDVYPDWIIPDNYSVVLYDEGTSPNPNGGTPTIMHGPNAVESISFSTQTNVIHYFRIVVTNELPADATFPTLGWYLFAQPHQGEHALSSILVRRQNTRETLSYCDAWMAGWVQADFYWWDHDNPGYQSISCDLFTDVAILRQCRGYWICTNIDGIEFIFP